jgi:hypothetical protein
MLIIIGKCEKLQLQHPLSYLMSKKLNDSSDSVDLKKCFHHQIFLNLYLRHKVMFDK